MYLMSSSAAPHNAGAIGDILTNLAVHRNVYGFARIMQKNILSMTAKGGETHMHKT